ncbi:MAG TPA: PilN domain-containing protein [Candidatus Saccharimonadales bacterium]|nr:PilN domain-containing protein [Candidatus Saccharimonadales bacterium]
MARSAQPKTPDLNIDLLPKETPSATSGEAVHWALSVGRYLIIATEIVALGAFLIAIWFSKEKNDLRTDVKSYQSEIAGYQTCDPVNKDAFCEDRFRKVQSQISQVGTLQSGQFQTSKVLTELQSLLPVGIKLDSLSIDKNILSISGQLPSETELQTLINSFNNSDKIVALDITSLTKENNQLKFTATATVMKEKFSGAAQ